MFHFKRGEQNGTIEVIIKRSYEVGKYRSPLIILDR